MKMDSDALKSPLRPSMLVTPRFRGHGGQGGWARRVTPLGKDRAGLDSGSA